MPSIAWLYPVFSNTITTCPSFSRHTASNTYTNTEINCWWIIDWYISQLISVNETVSLEGYPNLPVQQLVRREKNWGSQFRYPQIKSLSQSSSTLHPPSPTLQGAFLLQHSISNIAPPLHLNLGCSNDIKKMMTMNFNHKFMLIFK